MRSTMPAPNPSVHRSAGPVAATAPDTLRAALRDDLDAATVSRTLTLVGVPVLVVFEWGAGNDLINVVAITGAYGAASGVVAVALAAAVGFVVPLVMQTLTGAAAAHGLPTLRNTTSHLHHRLVRRRPDLAGASYSRLARFDRWAISVALGTTAAVLIEQTTTGRVGVRAHTRTILESATYMAATTAVVSGALAALLESARSYGSLAPIVDPIHAVVVNPFVWAALFVAIGAVRLLTGRTVDGITP